MGLRYLGNIIKPGYNPLASNITTGVNTAQYQGVFTLQQQAQAQNTQAWATDPLFENTTLLLQADNAANGAQNNTFLDSSSNNFTITRNGNTTQGSFTPFSATGWSNYFDGTGDYLTLADSSDWVIDTDYTIEFWAYATSFPAQYSNFISQRGGASSYWGLNWDTSTGWGFFWNNGSGETKISRNQNSPLNNWVHVAVVKSGTTGYIFFNGTQAGATFTFGSISDVSSLLYIGAWYVPTDYFNGYISNLRLVKGTALYTSNFTPSTTALTAVTNTKLLTCQSNRFIDNSTNNFTITRNGDTSVQAFSPFAPQYQYTPTVTGGSGYFDGSGDYLSAANNAAFNLNGVSFTVECWVYWNSVSGEQNIVEQFTGPSGPGWTLYKFSGGTIDFYGGSSGSINSGVTPVTGQWYHLAVSRNNSTGTTSFYVNGTRTATATFGVASSSSTALLVGVRNGGSTWLNGYIEDLRVVKGSYAYDPTQTTIPIPTAPLTAITNTSLLLNFTNAGITDGTLKNNLETVGNAQVSTSVVKYGTGSMYFDGSGDFLTIPATPNMAMGTGDFTIEGWVYPSSLAAVGAIVSLANTFVFYINTSGVIFYGIFGSSDTSFANAALSTNTWVHLAFVRASGVLKCYVNGTYTGTSISSTGSVGTATDVNYVGQHRSSNYFNGYLDDLRITKGIARYTQNFTPPSVALPRQ